MAFANGFAGARALGEGALAIATGREPELPVDEAPPALGATTSWPTTFPVAASEGTLVLGIDWLNARAPAAERPREGRFRVGEAEWSPERLGFDQILDGRAQRAAFSDALLPGLHVLSGGRAQPQRVRDHRDA